MTEANSQGARHSAAHAGGQTSRVAKATADLSNQLPDLDVESVGQPTGTPVITFDHVSKVYPAQPSKPALNDISVQVYAVLVNPPSFA